MKVAINSQIQNTCLDYNYWIYRPHDDGYIISIQDFFKDPIDKGQFDEIVW